MENFLSLYQDEHVITFFNQMGKSQPKERMDDFCKYHTLDLLKRWLNLFPPPSIWEIWNRWNKIK